MSKRPDEFIDIDEATKRRKKKEKPTGLDNGPLNKQVMNDDTLTIEDVKQFIADAKKKQEDYRIVADRSWNEIEKRNKDGKLFGGNDLYATRRWTRFPLWWSCLKIRQPLTLARLPIPILKDTQGDDPFGRTACVVGERLTRGILKTFEAFPEFASATDDFLVTNFGWGQAFYKMSTCIEAEKVRLQVIQPPPPQEPPQQEMAEPGQEPAPQEMQEPPQPMPPIFLTPDGQEVPQEQVQEDDLGPYLLTGEKVEIENEEVYWQAHLYKNLLADPDMIRWNQGTRHAVEYPYSYREFKEKFGQAALDKLTRADIEEHKSGKKPIIVYVYMDELLKEVRWFADNSNDFFQPLEMAKLNAEGEVDNSDLYGLTNFFPFTEPLAINQSTRQFWPTPEYFQVCDIIDDIHSLVGRMIQLTKAIRVRFLFDSSVTELKTLIGENWAMGEGTGMGIPDLETTLMNNKGSLSNLVAYFPVEELIEGLKNMYGAFQQRLDMFYQITGISDLIRGQTNPDSDKTFGERQMEGKYALNRIEPFQNKVQEWIKNQYQLLMEMGLKMFSEKSIDEYITPQTLDEEDKQRYVASLELLKDNKRRRFRVDFETDSTIAINEEWKKSKAIETANVISKMIESTAQVAEAQPGIAQVELKLMQHVVGDLVDGKLFIDEIQDSIQEVIDKVNQPKEPEFNKDAAAHEIAKERLVFDQQRAVFEDQLLQQKQSSEAQFEQIKLQSEAQIEVAKLQQQERFEGFANQLEQIRIGNETGLRTAELNQKASELQANIALAEEELLAKRAQFLLDAKEITSKSELKQLELMMDTRVAEQKKQLEELYFGLEKEKVVLDEKEKYMTEARLQAEHQLNAITNIVELHKTIKEMKQAPAPVTVHLQAAPIPEPPPAPKPVKKRRKAKIIRDPVSGLATDLHIEDEDG